MGFPAAIAKAQRNSLYAEVIEALDKTEAVHRQLQDIDAPHLVDLNGDRLAAVKRAVATAYEQLASARALVDPGDAA